MCSSSNHLWCTQQGLQTPAKHIYNRWDFTTHVVKCPSIEVSISQTSLILISVICKLGMRNIQLRWFNEWRPNVTMFVKCLVVSGSQSTNKYQHSISMHGLQPWTVWLCILLLTFAICVTLTKISNFSIPQPLHLKMQLVRARISLLDFMLSTIKSKKWMTVPHYSD